MVKAKTLAGMFRLKSEKLWMSMAKMPGIAGSDPDKCLLIKENCCNLGCFFLLAPGFWGQKQHFKVRVWVFFLRDAY